VAKSLARLRVLSSLLYIGTDVVAAISYGEYHSFTSRFFSELMARGAPTKALGNELAAADGWLASIQDRTHALLERAAAANMEMLDAIRAAKMSGVAPAGLAGALELQRKAQWPIDFVAAENSMGFHAPAEAARILAESIDFARQAELAARKAVAPSK
jgi:hypothetical protein